MKRFAIAALILGTILACTKSNIQYGPTGEITLQPVAEKATKAALSGTSYTDGAPAFNVWAWWAGVEPGTSTDVFLSSSDIESYIDKGEFVHRSSGSWGGSTPYYWPPEGSLVFAGYSPSGAQEEIFKYDRTLREFSATDYIQSNDIAQTVDLMWFDITDKSYNTNNNKNNNGQVVNGVPVVFQHALSWLQFRFQIKDAPGIYQNWLITDVRLTGMETKADFHSEGTPAQWTGHEDPKEIHVWSGSHLASTTPEVLESTPNGVVVIPQSCASPKNLVVTYNLKRYLGGKDDWLRAQMVTLPLDSGIDGSTWLPGKKYIYTIVFGENEIRIAPAIEKDWDDQNLDIEVQ